MIKFWISLTIMIFFLSQLTRTAEKWRRGAWWASRSSSTLGWIPFGLIDSCELMQKSRPLFPPVLWGLHSANQADERDGRNFCWQVDENFRLVCFGEKEDGGRPPCSLQTSEEACERGMCWFLLPVMQWQERMW